MDKLYIINLTFQFVSGNAAFQKKYSHKILYCCYITLLSKNELKKIYVKPYYDRHVKKNLGKSFVNHLIQETIKDSYRTIFHGSINYVKLIELIQDYLGIFPNDAINCIHIREIKIR